MVRDNRHDSAYLFGAICPARGIGAAIIMPGVNTEAMNQHLSEISTQVAPGAHAILVCDSAGWHQPGGRLCVPDNITLLPLPPYSPELNPMETVWEYLRKQTHRFGLGKLRGHRRGVPTGVALSDRSSPAHPIARSKAMGIGQCLSGLVLPLGQGWTLVPTQFWEGATVDWDDGYAHPVKGLKRDLAGLAG